MALRLALDTNRYTDLCRGHARVVEAVAAAQEIWLPFIVLAELRAGFAVGTQGPHNEAVLRRSCSNLVWGFYMQTSRPLITIPQCPGN